MKIRWGFVLFVHVLQSSDGVYLVKLEESGIPQNVADIGKSAFAGCSSLSPETKARLAELGYTGPLDILHILREGT